MSEPNRVFAQQVALPVVSADRTEATAQRFTSPEPNTTFSDNTILSASEVAAERFAAGSVVTRSYQATALTDPETVGYGSQLEPLSGQFIARSSLSSGGSSLAEFVATRQTAGEWAGQLAVSLQSNPGLASPANAISEPIPFEPIYAKPTKGQSKTSNEAALQRQNLEPKGVVAASLEAVSNQAATVALTQREANTRATSPTSRSAENQATLQAQLEAGLTNVKATEPISNEAVLQSQKLEPQAAAAQTQLEASVKATESISNEAVLQRQKLEPQAAASQIELQADLTTAKATKYNQFLPTGEGAWIPTSAPSRPLLSQFITPFGKKPLELAGMLYPSTWIEREVEEPASSQSWEAVPLLYRANPANKPEVSPENKMSASSVASTRTTSERIKVTGTESASDSFVVTPQSKAEQIATGTPSSSDSFAVTPQSKAEQSVKEKAGTPSNFGTSKTTPQAVNREQEVKPFDPQIQSGAVSSNALLRALERGQLPTVLARVLEQTELNSWLQSAGAEEAPTSVLSESASRKFAMPLLTLRKAKTYAPSPKPTSPDNWSEAEGSGFTPSSPLARSYQPSEPLMGRSEEQPVRQSSEPLVERSAEQPTERSSERILPNSTIGAQRGELGEFIVARRYFEDWAAQLPTLRTNLGLVQPSDSEPIGFEAAYVNYTKQAKNLSASKTSKEKGSAKPTTPISAAVQRAPALWDAALPVDPNKAALPADTNSQQVPPEVPKIFASSPGLSRSMTESAHSSSVKAEADGAIEVPPPAKPVYQTETDSLDAEGAWVPESSNPLVSRFGEPTNQDIGVMGMLHPATWIQRKASTSESAVRPVTPIGLPPLNTILRSAVGKPIENSVQTRMSQIFRKSFENVRVHTDEPAAGYAKEMGAEAFTVGQNIFFGAGRYQPETPLGQALLGHELTHVVQQTSLPSLGGGRIPETSTAGRAFEHEAINNESLILRHLSDNKASNSSYDSLTFPVERSFVPLEPLHLSNKVLQRSPDSSAVIERSTTGSSGSGDSSSSSTSVVAPTTEETKEKEALTKAEMNSIVREVYRLLKQQLLTDRERHGARGGLLL
ncbi:MAG: DUF4157 domain-containing protein [Chloroflexi bacterium]|nr:DUF4157 domain-containing protein [Chloroflexota bacterium]